MYWFRLERSIDFEETHDGFQVIYNSHENTEVYFFVWINWKSFLWTQTGTFVFFVKYAAKIWILFKIFFLFNIGMSTLFPRMTLKFLSFKETS